MRNKWPFYEACIQEKKELVALHMSSGQSQAKSIQEKEYTQWNRNAYRNAVLETTVRFKLMDLVSKHAVTPAEQATQYVHYSV